MIDRSQTTQDLRLEEAAATGSLLAIVSTMLIYHANGGETVEHWARLREAYDGYQAASRTVIDHLCARMDAAIAADPRAANDH